MCKQTAKKDLQRKVDFQQKEDHVLTLWRCIQPYLFPVLPQTTESFISLMFWHSFLTTASTPLHRYVSGGWRGVSSLFWIIESYAPKWIANAIVKHGIGTPYPQEGEAVEGFGTTRGIDRGFGLHALFSLLWLVIAYIQIVHSRKIQTKLHRYLGFASIVVFIGHSIAGLHTVYADIVRHTAIVKLMFIAVVLDHASQFFRAVYYATKRGNNWYMLHQDEMVILFLGSIGGAGPIRAIAEVQTLLGYGTALCQAQYTGMATKCQLEYMNRLVLVGLWCYYMKGVYVAMRNNDSLTKDYAVKAFSFVCIMACIIGFSYVPFAGNMLPVAFGEPRSLQNTCLTLIGTIFLAQKEVGGLLDFCAQRNKIEKSMAAKAA